MQSIMTMFGKCCPTYLIVQVFVSNYHATKSRSKTTGVSWKHWPDAAFSIVFLWFLDLEALLWIRRKGDQTSSYDSAPMLSSMLHGRSNEFLNGLCAHVTSAITGPLGRIVTTSEIPSCGTSTCKIHHDGDAALIWMQCCTLFENQPKCLILHHLLSY